MRVDFIAFLAVGLCAIYPSISLADEATNARKLVASTLANIDRVEQTYLRNVVTKPCNKMKNVLITNMFPICSTFGGVLGHQLLDSDPISCNNAQVYCGYTKIIAKLGTQKVIELSNILPKKLKPLNSRVISINRSIAQINAQAAKRIVRRDDFAFKCTLDPVKNRSKCRQAASESAAVDRATARVSLKQTALGIINEGIDQAYMKINRIVMLEDMGAGYAVRVRAAYVHAQERMCGRIEIACAPTPTPSETLSPEPSPVPTLTP